MKMIAAAVFVLFCAFSQISLSTSMPTRRQATFSHIFSSQTAQFVRFLEDGTVLANGQPGHPESQIKIQYLANGQVRIQYMMDTKDCYLVFENGQFRGSTPVAGNEIFELVEQDGFEFLRLVNYMVEEEASSGSGAEETEEPASEEPTSTTEAVEEPTGTTDVPTGTTEATEELTGTTKPSQTPTATVCYLGFPDGESAPRCYDSYTDEATKFKILHF